MICTSPNMLSSTFKAISESGSLEPEAAAVTVLVLASFELAQVDSLHGQGGFWLLSHCKTKS